MNGSRLKRLSHLYFYLFMRNPVSILPLVLHVVALLYSHNHFLCRQTREHPISLKPGSGNQKYYSLEVQSMSEPEYTHTSPKTEIWSRSYIAHLRLITSWTKAHLRARDIPYSMFPILSSTWASIQIQIKLKIPYYFHIVQVIRLD